MSVSESDVQELIDRILLDPKNLSHPTELHQQAKAALNALTRADADHNMVISVDEVSRLMEEMGLPLEDNDDTLMKLDKDESGVVEYMEFLEFWLRRISTQPGNHKQQEVIATNTFKLYDRDHSGAISSSEFAALVETLGASFSAKELQQAMQELDTDGSGVIECDEFVSWWINRNKAVRRGGGLIAFKLKKLANRAAQMFYTDIHTAAWKGNVELVKLFLDSENSLRDASDTSEYGAGWTPLQYASYQGHIEVVRELLSRGANVNRTNDFGFTALFYAAQMAHCDVCEVLIEAGADLSICGCDDEASPSKFCPTDHIVDTPELRDIFMTNEKCTAPGEIEIDPSSVEIDRQGAVVFRVTNLKEVSYVPVQLYQLHLLNNDKEISQMTCSVPPGTVMVECLVKDIDELEELVLCGKENELFLRVAATNAFGEGPLSDKLAVQISPDLT